MIFFIAFPANNGAYWLVLQDLFLSCFSIHTSLNRISWKNGNERQIIYNSKVWLWKLRYIFCRYVIFEWISRKTTFCISERKIKFPISTYIFIALMSFDEISHLVWHVLINVAHSLKTSIILFEILIALSTSHSLYFLQFMGNCLCVSIASIIFIQIEIRCSLFIIWLQWIGTILLVRSHRHIRLSLLSISSF